MILSAAHTDPTGTEQEQRPMDPYDMIRELYNLLNEHEPAWYTKGHEKRILAALDTELFHDDLDQWRKLDPGNDDDRATIIDAYPLIDPTILAAAHTDPYVLEQAYAQDEE